VRATLTVTFKEYQTLEEQLTRLNLLSSDHTRRRLVRRGDTLSRIAFEEYDDATEWPRIADHAANRGKLGDLRRLTPGLEIEIPAIDPFEVKRRPS
jgi:nucleoid-associated protein YgaU